MSTIPRIPCNQLDADGTIVCGGFHKRPDGTLERAHYRNGLITYYATAIGAQDLPMWSNERGGPLGISLPQVPAGISHDMDEIRASIGRGLTQESS